MLGIAVMPMEDGRVQVIISREGEDDQAFTCGAEGLELAFNSRFDLTDARTVD